MRCTVLEEIKSTLPKSLFYNHYSQIKSNQMLVFYERGKPEYPGKNLSWQSRGPTNSIHIWHWVRKSNPGHIGGRHVLSPLGQPYHLVLLDTAHLARSLTPCSCGFQAYMADVGVTLGWFWYSVRMQFSLTMSLRHSFISLLTWTLFFPSCGLSAIRPSLMYLAAIPLAVDLFTPIVAATVR